MAKHQLDDPDVHAIRQEPARAFVSEVVPAEIDPLKLLTIPRSTFPRRSRLDAVGQSRSVSQAVWYSGSYSMMRSWSSGPTN